MMNKATPYMVTSLIMLTFFAFIHGNRTSTSDCIQIPDEATGWEIYEYNMKKVAHHSIPSRPKCLKPSDIQRLQRPAIISVFTPNFSQFLITAYRIDSIRITTECYIGFFGSYEKIIMGRERQLLSNNDQNLFISKCKDKSCPFEFTRLIIGESKLYPRSEEYDCGWCSTRRKQSNRFVITAISIQFKSDGLIIHPNMGQNCNVYNSTSCIHAANQFMLIYPQTTFDSCNINLKLMAPGVVSWTKNQVEIDNKTYISVPDQHLSFWFNEPLEEIPVVCNKDGLKIKESSDGYLIGISSLTDDNYDVKNDIHEAHFVNSKSINQSNVVTKLSSRFRRANYYDGKMTYENLQRSYSRAELQYGLNSLHSKLKYISFDVNHELCKIRAQLWDNAFTHLFDNPDIMARFIYPLEMVKGIYSNNMLQVVFGVYRQDICIPHHPTFEGLHMKLMIKGQYFWLHATTGELLSTSPTHSKQYNLASFTIPVYPTGYYDVIDRRYTVDPGVYIKGLSSNSSIWYSGSELYNLSELTPWTSDFQIYETKQLEELSKNQQIMIDPLNSFNEHIIIPMTNFWNSMSFGFRSTLSWIAFGGGVLLFFYIIANIIIPLFKMKQRHRLLKEKNLIKQERLELEKRNLQAF